MGLCTADFGGVRVRQCYRHGLSKLNVIVHADSVSFFSFLSYDASLAQVECFESLVLTLGLAKVLNSEKL